MPDVSLELTDEGYGNGPRRKIGITITRLVPGPRPVCMWCGKRLNPETTAAPRSSWELEGPDGARKIPHVHTGRFGYNGQNLFCSQSHGYRFGVAEAIRFEGRGRSQARLTAEFRLRVELSNRYPTVARLKAEGWKLPENTS